MQNRWGGVVRLGGAAHIHSPLASAVLPYQPWGPMRWGTLAVSSNSTWDLLWALMETSRGMPSSVKSQAALCAVWRNILSHWWVCSKLCLHHEWGVQQKLLLNWIMSPIMQSCCYLAAHKDCLSVLALNIPPTGPRDGLHFVLCYCTVSPTLSEGTPSRVKIEDRQYVGINLCIHRQKVHTCFDCAKKHVVFIYRL